MLVGPFSVASARLDAIRKKVPLRRERPPMSVPHLSVVGIRFSVFVLHGTFMINQGPKGSVIGAGICAADLPDLDYSRKKSRAAVQTRIHYS